MPSLLRADCPRCNTRASSFDVFSDQLVGEEYGWQRIYESFAVCRICHRSTVFVLAQTVLLDRSNPNYRRLPSDCPASTNDMYRVASYINIKDMGTMAPPEHCPPSVAAAFREGATCLAVECFNAAGCMFRLCIDLASKTMLPAAGTPEAPGAQARENLFHRLNWLVGDGKIPEDLHDLAHGIREDGNDGAHAGTLTKDEADDLQEFSRELLERVYALPGRVKAAAERRAAKKAPKK
jgi:uncharacterized protein DUF4145